MRNFILALHPSNFKPEIFTRLLEDPDIDIDLHIPPDEDIDIYMNLSGYSAFMYTRGNATLILRLLQADSNVAARSMEEKTEMAITIASTMKPFNLADLQEQAEKTNAAVCQSVKNAYPTDQEKEDLITTINKHCGFTRHEPQGLTVLSYLFKPKSVYLNEMESMYGNVTEKMKTEKMEWR